MSNKILNQFVNEVVNIIGENEREEVIKLKKESLSETKERIEKTEKEKEKLLDLSRLPTMTKPELTMLCKKFSLKVTGKKEELVERIKKHVNSNNEVISSTSTSSSASASSTKPKNTRKTKEEKEQEKKEKEIKEEEDREKKKKLYKQFEKEVIKVRKNKFGNFEHTETGLIFDKYDKNVIGKQCSSGKILTLTEKDIMTCKLYDFDYILPYDLNDEETKTKYSDTLKNELGEEDKEDKEDKEDADLDELENPIDEEEDDADYEEGEDEIEGEETEEVE